MGKKKAIQTEQIIEQLEAQRQAVLPEDSLAEAGRKVLQGEFIRMLKHEVGSRTGEDIEDVHKMRVAIRQMRSALRLLEDDFKPGTLRPLRKDLKRVMSALGPVRDLDVMIHDLSSFAPPEAEAQTALRDVIDSLDQRRQVARMNLLNMLDSKNYRRFVHDFTDFLITPGAGARSNHSESAVVPFQVRHVLPPMIYQHLAAVRAYEPVIEEADAATLHALRIEFKRLRYIISLFSDVLGKDIEGFVTELKHIQDHLGRMNDIHVAHDLLTDLMEDLDGDQNAVLWLYLENLEKELPALREKFPAVWQRFNTKTVQRKLASAVAAL